MGESELLKHRVQLLVLHVCILLQTIQWFEQPQNVTPLARLEPRRRLHIDLLVEVAKVHFVAFNRTVCVCA